VHDLAIKRSLQAPTAETAQERQSSPRIYWAGRKLPVNRPPKSRPRPGGCMADRDGSKQEGLHAAPQDNPIPRQLFL
jgi:hypothetical protein